MPFIPNALKFAVHKHHMQR